MPKITLTDKDIARMNPPDAGVHLAELKAIREEASKDKLSINYHFDFEVISNGDNQGRMISAMANSKAITMVVGPLMSAIFDIPKEDIKAGEIDIDTWIGKRVGIEVYDDIYDGRPIRKIKGFANPAKMNAPF